MDSRVVESVLGSNPGSTVDGVVRSGVGPQCPWLVECGSGAGLARGAASTAVALVLNPWTRSDRSLVPRQSRANIS